MHYSKVLRQVTSPNDMQDDCDQLWALISDILTKIANSN